MYVSLLHSRQEPTSVLLNGSASVSNCGRERWSCLQGASRHTPVRMEGQRLHTASQHSTAHHNTSSVTQQVCSLPACRLRPDSDRMRNNFIVNFCCSFQKVTPIQLTACTDSNRLTTFLSKRFSTFYSGSRHHATARNHPTAATPVVQNDRVHTDDRVETKFVSK